MEDGALIVLRVEDPMDNAEQPVGKQWRWYTTTSGIWQTVFIEPAVRLHQVAFSIAPDIDKGTAQFRVECPNAGNGSRREDSHRASRVSRKTAQSLG